MDGSQISESNSGVFQTYAVFQNRKLQLREHWQEQERNTKGEHWQEQERNTKRSASSNANSGSTHNDGSGRGTCQVRCQQG